MGRVLAQLYDSPPKVKEPNDVYSSETFHGGVTFSSEKSHTNEIFTEPHFFLERQFVRVLEGLSDIALGPNHMGQSGTNNVINYRCLTGIPKDGGHMHARSPHDVGGRRGNPGEMRMQMSIKSGLCFSVQFVRVLCKKCYEFFKELAIAK